MILLRQSQERNEAPTKGEAVEAGPVDPCLTTSLVQENRVEYKQRSERSRIFNEREERWIVHINPRTSALEMTL
ncbi:hypothetical protein TNCV_4778761 [Trichonephila clavipes]|nr:hypothetical protein TNCV_4778761 [Trichonephila clavipes]